MSFQQRDTPASGPLTLGSPDSAQEQEATEIAEIALRSSLPSQLLGAELAAKLMP